MTACWCSHVVSQVDWFAAYPLGPVVLGTIAINVTHNEAKLNPKVHREKFVNMGSLLELCFS